MSNNAESVVLDTVSRLRGMPSFINRRALQQADPESGEVVGNDQSSAAVIDNSESTEKESRRF